jgi:hypothetical protein
MAINSTTREVTLKGSHGREFTLRCRVLSIRFDA